MSLVKEGLFITGACQRRPCPSVATSPDHGLNSVTQFVFLELLLLHQSQPPSARQSYDKAVLILKMLSCTCTLLGGVYSSGVFSQSGVLDLREVELIKVVDDRAVSDKDQCNAVHPYICALACGGSVYALGKKRNSVF